MPQPRQSDDQGGAGRRRRAAGGSARRPPAAKRSGGQRSSSGSGRTAPAAKRTSATTSSRGGGGSRTTGPPTGARGRSSATARRTTSRPAPAESGAVAQGFDAVRSALAGGAQSSLSVVMLTQQKIQESVDDAVARGQMTREAANGLVAELVRRGRREAEDALAELEQLVGRAGRRVRTSGPAAQLGRARRATGVGPSFPITAYDDLTAAQIADRLRALTPAQLRRVRDHERRHGNRKSVLNAIERRLA
jgi:hypothetical protein